MPYKICNFKCNIFFLAIIQKLILISFWVRVLTMIDGTNPTNIIYVVLKISAKICFWNELQWLKCYFTVNL